MKLLLLDAYALIFRAYYAMIRNPRITTKGVNTSAIFGFVNMLQDLLKRERPTHIAVCFDPGGKTFRHEEYPEYKANRDATPEDIKVAVPFIKRILEAYRIAVFQVDGFEADDVIGTLAKKASKQGVLTYMVTGDKDFAQLVEENIKIYNPAKDELLGPEEVNAKYGLQSPKQVIDMLGLMGDSADNIPGCPGVGLKTAEKLIQEFGSVENLLEHTDQLKGALQKRVRENSEQILLSKSLATIMTEVPVDFNLDVVKRVPANLNAIKTVFDELEFRSLIARIVGNNEANIGLTTDATQASTQAPVKPVDKPNASSQPSLFDFDDDNAYTDDIEQETAPTHKTISDVTHDYRLITDYDEAQAFVERLLTLPAAGVCLIADGEEAMRANILGIALADDRHQAAYIPLDDGFGWMNERVMPIFNGKTTLVGNDIKRIMVALGAQGHAFNAPFFDIAVAHYTLFSEHAHDTAAVALQMMNYEAIDFDSLLSAKAKKVKSLAGVPAEKIHEYACEQADLALQLQPVITDEIERQGIAYLLRDIEMPLVPVLARMELAGARIDPKALKDYSVTLSERLIALDKECHELAGETFNTASPMQVGDILFGKLNLDPKAKKTKSGHYSTSEDILSNLIDRHPLVAKILEVRGIRKLLSTYVDALPLLINPKTGRIHTTYNQTITATGRLSSTNPNLQNIPVRGDEGKEIRKAFIPADGNVFFSADYSQIELRIVADLSGDETMLNAFRHNQDIHAITAARIYHEDINNVTPDQRRKAKTANFGILYGISAFGLSQRLNIPRNESKMLIEGYFASFPKVREYIDRQTEQARQHGYVTTLFGRRRMLPDINSRNAVVRSFSERNAVNAPIQGTAADIIKKAMIAIDRRFRQENLKSKMILQVHDELNFDVVPQEVDRVTDIVVNEMEAAYQGHVTLTASHATAANWLDAH